MAELWQLYDEQGRALSGQAAHAEEIVTKGLLHGASQVWIWRINEIGKIEVLLQKRAASKRTWPSLLDISAAGHIDLGEDPLVAALRETKEEIGLDIDEQELRLISIQRQYMVTPSGDIENEFCWMYSLKLIDNISFQLRTQEVEAVVWKELAAFRTEVNVNSSTDMYVPHGELYYEIVLSAIEEQLQESL